MKRDMDLCRTLLIELESAEQLQGWVDLEIAGRSDEEVTYHIRLLQEAGLIEAQDLTTLTSTTWKAKRLTWAGHEFLSAAHNESVWTKAKSFVIEKTGTLSLELLKVGLSEVTKGLLTGKIPL